MRRVGIGVVTFVGAALLVAVNPASAGIGLGVVPTFPTVVAVGQTNLPASLTISNNSTPPETAGVVILTDITLVPSCGTTGGFGDCPPASAEPGVFQISATGVGEPGTACAAVPFTVTTIDATGKVRFSPFSPVVLGSPSIPTTSTCTIDFTFSVPKAPLLDSSPVLPGVQTAQKAAASGTSNATGVTGSGFGNGQTTVIGATFSAVSPARVWDSRFGPGPTGRIGAGATRSVVVTGVGGVPASGVTAVVLNVTAVNPSAGTFVTVWPTGETRPLASNLNVPPGDTRPNLVIVKVGASGTVSFYNDAGALDLIADVAGWYGADGGQRYTAVSPARVWDTRFGPGPTGRVGAGGIRDVTVTGIGGVPASGVTGVVLNVTGVNPSAGTFVTAWPTGESRPLASNLNVPPGDTRPNLVIVKVGASGTVSFYNDAGTIDLIADVAGWYGAPG